MLNVRGIGRRGQIKLAGAIAACLIAGAPAANAVFTRAADAGTMAVGTYTLAAPTGNVVVPLCTPNGASGKYRLTVTVASHGTVPKATHYVLTLRDAAGVAQSTTTLTPLGSGTSNNAVKGWGYTIDAQYRTASTTWSSTSTPITAC